MTEEIIDEVQRKRPATNEDASDRPTKQLSKPSTLCPYLGTVNRHLLDFDFEKLCSVSLTNLHVYCCLVCGKYFEGRGKDTHADIHALEEEHYIFINLSDCRIWCLPEDYEIDDASLNDVKHFLNPRYSREDVLSLSRTAQYGKSLDGSDFIAGCVGLNNLGKTDYCNVVVQLLCHVIPMRNELLLLDLSRKQRPNRLLLRCGELLRKIFNLKNFKGVVSPHEFLQAVSVCSSKNFRIGSQSDPLYFLTWLLEQLHQKLRRRDTEQSVVRECFEGEVLVTDPDGTRKTNPFRLLTLDLPAAPILRDSFERNILPQVPVFDLLQKFDGETPQEFGGVARTLSLWKLPRYLVFHIKRFSKNNFYVEKNPTIMTFPVKHLDLKEYIHPDAAEANPVTRYNLITNIIHVGKPSGGIYKVHVLHGPANEWFEIEDLRVTAVLPQQVAQSESYIQVYQREDVQLDGTLSM